MSSLSDRITGLSPQKRELLLRKLQGARKEKPDAITIRRRIEQDRYPLSHSQRRLWFLDQLEPGKASYNIPAGLRFSGALDTAALERSLDEILRRHEVLRSTFITAREEPEQIILPSLTLSLPVTDLQSLPEEEREPAALRLANAEARIPFDLARGPLVRASLVRLAENDHILILVMHHIVADGWSAGVFLRELATIYQAFAARRPSPLAELPIQYADFAHWQQEEQMKGDLLASQIAYWTKQLGGAPPVLDWAADRPRPPIQTYNGAHLAVTLPKQLAADVAAFSQREGVTSFVTLLAAFQTLLSRYTGQEDLCVGTPVANRRYAELDGLIGFFVNTLVMRADVSGNPSFRDLLRLVRETHLAADANQDLPFEMLVEAMQPERDMSRSPLFQVMFAYQQPVAAPDLPGLAIRALEIETGTAKFDLLLTVELAPTGLRTIWEYNTDLFDKATIARMAGHYQTLLAAAVADPDLQISRLPILTNSERRRVLDEWNSTAITYHPRPVGGACLHRLFEAQVARTPSATALVYQDQRLSYSALNKRANQLARRLQRLGVGPESLVGVSMERSLEMVIALYAILKAGGAYVPIDPTNPPERVAFMLGDARPPVLLTQSHLLSRLPFIETGHGSAAVICLDAEHGGAAWNRLAEEQADNLDSGATEENLAYAIYTSGSTGQPKCALIPHKGICNRLFWMQDEYPLTSEDCVLQKTPFSFDVSVWEFFWPLQVGARLAVARPEGHKDSDYLIELIKRERVTTIHFVPSMLQTFLENERAEECRSLRRVICSGEALPFELQQRFFARMEKAELHNLYGPTEASVDVSYWACERNGKLRTVPIGRPIANTQLYILDRHLQPVPIGVPGELHIGGVNVGRGYLNRPELTAEKFIELRIEGRTGSQPVPGQVGNLSYRVYKTGDLTRFLPDGAIEYLGRLDHQVKIRGFRIELGEIEVVLEQHPAIRKAAVIAREERGDKQLVAYCVPEEMPGPAASELRSYLKEKLPDYMAPAAMVMLEALPLSPNGKLDRRALPAPGKADTASDSPYVAPRTPVEEMLAGMWAEVLGIEFDHRRVGVNDNFFELGGHSLLATRLVSRIRDAFRVNLPLRTLFEEPTVAELALRLEAARAGDAGALLAPDIIPASREGRLPLSYAQQRLWFLHQLEPESSFYNIPAFVRMRGRLDIAALERSLGEVVRRHEAMRTIFPDLDGDPAQVIQAPRPVNLRVAELDSMEKDTAVSRDEVIRTLAGIELREPFDLAVGPLWRAHLLRLAEDDHILFLVMHHIIADGWAMNLLVEEVGQLYTAFSVGQPSPLADLPVQYADYARWQRDWLQGETLERQLDYWRGCLGGAPMQLDLPADRTRPPMQTYNGAAQTFTLPVGLANRLRALSRQEGATLFMTTLAAFQTLLYRYTGQESINVGTPIANRTRSEIERLLGCFINTLVLRSDFSGDPSFREVVRQVREAALGAYTHQDVPFEMLVDALEPERDLSRSPLFQVMFSLEERPTMERSLPGLSLEALPTGQTEKTTAKFDLSLEMWPVTDGKEGETLRGEFEYNTDLFDAATIERMLGHFTTLVESLAADPDQRVSRAPLQAEAERRRMLVEWNSTAVAFPSDRCVHQLIEAQAARRPDAAAVVYNGQELDYRELNSRANRLASHLRTLGVGPETVVACSLERSPELVVALLAVLKAGGAYLPLDPLHPEERLAAILSDAGPRVVLTEQALLPKFAACAAEVVCLDRDAARVSRESDENPPNLAAPENLAYVIYTSGSTGKPKGVMIEHRSLANAFFAWNQAYGLDSIKSHLQMANVTFDVFTGDLVRALCSGGRLVLCPRDLLLSPPDLHELMRKERIESAEFVPAVLRQLAAYLEEKRQRLDFLRLLVCGSDAWTAGEYRRFRKLCGPETRLINSFGITEATIDSTWYERLDETIPADQPVPIGRPFANTQVYVLDRNRQPQPVGVTGELYLAGAGLARGYLNNAELTAERFVDLRIEDRGSRIEEHSTGNSSLLAPRSSLLAYKTGDLARWRADGTVQFLGRADAQVKIRGYRIETGEIEAALGAYPGLKQAVVTAHDDEAGRKRLVAYLVPAGGAEFDSTALRAHIREKLPEYMTPSAFVTLESLPLSSNGKVDRRRLPAPVFEAREASESAPPRTETEEKLAEIWKQVLGLKTVGIHDNFFELGGDSILSIQIISRARQAGLQLTPRQLFENPTVAGQASVAGFGQAIEAEQGIVTGEAPLTPIQRWFFEQDLPEPWHWNQTALLCVSGGMRRELLEATVGRLLQQHDALRMRYCRKDGAWVQTNAGEEAITPKTVCRWFDMAGMSADWQSAAITRHAEELQASLNLSEGPILRVAWFNLGPRQPGRLLVVIHHLVVDGVSWRVLMEDLQSLLGGTVKLPPKTTSFRQWARRLDRYAESEEARRELPYWQAATEGRTRGLPVDFPAGANTEASAASVVVGLNETETTALLREVPAAYGAEINDALLAALARALNDWACGPVLVNVEGHGREDIISDVDISRTVGWFTTEFPVRLEWKTGESPGETLMRIKERLRGIPNRGIGYGILKTSGGRREDRDRLAAAPQAEVGFNYLGQFDQTLPADGLFAMAKEPVGPSRSLAGNCSYPLEINGGITGGRLQLEWSYGARLYKRETIERVAQTFVTALRELIAHCQSPEAGGYTLSDFPDVDLSEEQLKVLIQGIG